MSYALVLLKKRLRRYVRGKHLLSFLVHLVRCLPIQLYTAEEISFTQIAVNIISRCCCWLPWRYSFLSSRKRFLVLFSRARVILGSCGQVQHTRLCSQFVNIRLKILLNFLLAVAKILINFSPLNRVTLLRVTSFGLDNFCCVNVCEATFSC